MKVLKGDRNQCQTCMKYFNSSGAFTKHRTGEFNNRRCLNTEEMINKGMILRADGFWIGSKNTFRSEHEA